MKMNSKMTEGRPLTLLLKFIIPIFLGFIFQQFYNMVDTVIVGRFVSPQALAAVGSTGTVMFLVMGLANGMTTGYTVLISQKFGAGDKEGTRGAFVNAILLGLISTAIITAIFIVLMNPLLKLMNTPEDIYADAYAYITTICAGSIALIGYNLLAASLRAIGNSRTPLYFLIFSAFMNIALDLVFIVLFHLGTFGAALATDISQGLSAILCMGYIIKNVDVLRPKLSDFHLNKEYSGKQLRIGIPMALQFGITASGTMVMQASINIYKSVALTGFTAAGKVINLMTAGMPSLGQTIAAYCGQNYGYGDLDRVHQGTRDAMKIAIVYSIVNAILSLGLLPIIIKFFFDANVDISVYMPYARTYVHECVFFFIPLAMIFIYRNAMQACGYGVTALALGGMELLARLITAFVSMAIKSYPLAVAGDALAWLLTGVFSYILYRFVMKDLYKKLGK
ncbi:MATE family efflux transporter [Butyrivibrio proteoclasticus]|uniref:MATE family efflux transporter n=1 Tax=Butyrivibrio proteoclasticus TaxID=43305 RepID=UPI000A886A12|nr:MATE family efflux transporter [Butyrivibrio proteoclasticus]